MDRDVSDDPYLAGSLVDRHLDCMNCEGVSAGDIGNPGLAVDRVYIGQCDLVRPTQVAIEMLSHNLGETDG